MNNNHLKFLNQLHDRVLEAPKLFRVQLGASIVYKNAAIAYGRNSLKTDPFQAKFSANEFSLHLHAEINAIKKALKKISVDQLQKCTLYVVRIRYNPDTKKMELGLSKPCRGCQSCIAEFGIKKVIYTTHDSGCAFL